jgi:Cys-tRNA(Pro) deacylase
VKRENAPETPATRFLKGKSAIFSSHLYAYVDRGGTRVASQGLGIDEHAVVKTLVMEDEDRAPLIVLMHGDRRVSTRELARVIGRREIAQCTPDAAERHTGFRVGGISPFGTKRKMTVYAEKSVFDLPRLYINGGRRGFLVGMDPRELFRVLAPTVVEIAAHSEGR